MLCHHWTKTRKHRGLPRHTWTPVNSVSFSKGKGTKHNPLYGVWIGLHHEEDGEPWVNIDGSDPDDYSRSNRREPNNKYNETEQVEDCVHIWHIWDESDIEQSWNDLYCNEVMSFVCMTPADEVAHLKHYRGSFSLLRLVQTWGGKLCVFNFTTCKLC